MDEKDSLTRLKQHLNSIGWLTRGSAGAYAIRTNNEIEECPAFTLNVKDTIGAGDAFYSVAGLFASVGADEDVCMVLGNVAGALGANIVGNKESIQKSNVLKFVSTLLNV